MLITATYLLTEAERPRKLRNAVLFLASEQASFINGSVVHLDGGHSANGGLGLILQGLVITTNRGDLLVHPLCEGGVRDNQTDHPRYQTSL